MNATIQTKRKWFNGVMPFDMLLLWEFNFVNGNFFVIILHEQTFRIGLDWFFPYDSVYNSL